MIKPTPNPPAEDLIPEFLNAQLPNATRLRFCFDEPLMTSDAGLLLLAREASQSGCIARVAQALAPKLMLKPAAALAAGALARLARAPVHSTQALLTQRVMQIIGGYPDGIDSNLLRHDPALQLLVGKALPGTPQAVLASQPTMSRLDNSASLHALVRAFDAMVDNFIASYGARGPAGLVLDLDPTACIVYGQQQLGMFNTHVGDTCLMPFHLYEGQSGRLIATALHSGQDAAGQSHHRHPAPRGQAHPQGVAARRACVPGRRPSQQARSARLA